MALIENIRFRYFFYFLRTTSFTLVLTHILAYFLFVINQYKFHWNKNKDTLTGTFKKKKKKQFTIVFLVVSATVQPLA